MRKGGLLLFAAVSDSFTGLSRARKGGKTGSIVFKSSYTGVQLGSRISLLTHCATYSIKCFFLLRLLFAVLVLNFPIDVSLLAIYCLSIFASVVAWTIFSFSSVASSQSLVRT